MAFVGDLVRRHRVASSDVVAVSWNGPALALAAGTVAMALGGGYERSLIRAAAGWDEAVESCFAVSLCESLDVLDDNASDCRLGVPPRTPGLFTVHPSLFEPSLCPPGKEACFCEQIAPWDLRDGGPEAWDEAKDGALSSEPMVEACLHSVLDETAAPPGKHVMSCFVQYGSLRLREGSWAERKAVAAERVIRVLGRYAPNLPAAVEAWHVYTPEDLEREFGLTGGNIYQGAMTPDQLFSFRPAAGYSSYGSPVEGLYLCGSGAHPGGGVWGAAGMNAAAEIVRHVRPRGR